MANNINDPEKYVSATATVAGVVFSFAFAFFKSWAYEPGEWSDKPIYDHLLILIPAGLGLLALAASILFVLYPNERIHKRLCAGWWLMFIGMFLILLAVSISTVSDIGNSYKKKAEQVTKCHQ
jgi:uncharacterized membrane protein